MIRQGIKADAQALANLVRGLGWFEYLEQEAETDTVVRIEQYIEQFIENPHNTFLVATDAHDLAIAFVVVNWQPYIVFPGCEGFISELFVHVDHRGNGTGKQLLQHIQEEGRQRNCFRLMLVNKKDRESYQRGFYTKAGWQERDGVANFIWRPL